MSRRPPPSEVDVVTAELVYAALVAISREMRANMVRTAYSSIIYEGQDFSCCLLDAEGRLIAKSPLDSPLHIVPVPWSVRAVIDAFRGDIHEGDVFLHNDPYTGGTHLNDIATIRPVFVDHITRAFAVVRAHWGDVGGSTPGSISGQVTEIIQEGLRLPPIRVYDRGEPVDFALCIIFANVRGERDRRGDFQSTIVSCLQAEKKFQAVVSKYGWDVVQGSMHRTLHVSEQRTREALAAVPDGVYRYEAYVESTGAKLEPLVASVAVEVDGSSLTADFRGSSPQSEGPINCGPSMTTVSVLAIVKSYLDSETNSAEDITEGSWAPLNVKAPVGSFLNARSPAACGGMVEARYVADTAMMGALASAVPELATGDNRGTANHVYIGGRDGNLGEYLFYEYPSGGTGAYLGGDGNNVLRSFQEPDVGSILPIEAIENESPLRVEECAIRVDSAGAGRWRGGFGLRRCIRLVAGEARLSILSDRNILGPHGVCGGDAGRGHRFHVVRNGVALEPSAIPGKVTGFRLIAGDLLVMETCGGGGYGDALEREPDAVWDDVQNGYLTSHAAERSYGVVLNRSGPDRAATRRLRGRLRRRRTFVTLKAGTGSEFDGSRRVVRLSAEAAARAGIREDEVVEIVNPRGAPLRAWVRMVLDNDMTASVGDGGMDILRAEGGARYWIRRLSAWGLTEDRNVKQSPKHARREGKA